MKFAGLFLLLSTVALAQPQFKSQYDKNGCDVALWGVELCSHYMEFGAAAIIQGISAEKVVLQDDKSAHGTALVVGNDSSLQLAFNRLYFEEKACEAESGAHCMLLPKQEYWTPTGSRSVGCTMPADVQVDCGPQWVTSRTPGVEAKCPEGHDCGIASLPPCTSICNLPLRNYYFSCQQGDCILKASPCNSRNMDEGCGTQFNPVPTPYPVQEPVMQTVLHCAFGWHVEVWQGTGSSWLGDAPVYSTITTAEGYRRYRSPEAMTIGDNITMTYNKDHPAKCVQDTLTITPAAKY